MISHDPKYGVGQKAEMAFQMMLQSRGWHVMPASTYTNNTGAEIGAPVIFISGQIKRCPDLYGFHKDKPNTWFEVKEKKEPTYYRKRHQYEHGTDAPNIRDYQDVQEGTSSQVLIVVPEKNSPIDPNVVLDMRLDPIGFHRKARENLKPNHDYFWLYISLDDALKIGEFRTGNRQMMKSFNREGEGLYWPRDAMRVIDL